MEQDIADCEELAGFTLDRLREALSAAETPAVAQIIEIIRKMSDKVDILPIQDLAEAIGHDLTTMVKVMKAANCLQFNPSALDVSTVARAVSVIGFNKIQILALSLLLLEGAENTAQSAEARQVSAGALSTALIAEEVTRKLSAGDPEEAFACAALRSYGHLLLSSFLVEDYRQAVRLSSEMPPDRAFRLTFGLTPLEVSQRIIGEVNLSGIGGDIFKPVSTAMLRNKNPSGGDLLILSADFGAAFSDLVSRPELNSASYEEEAAGLLEKYGKSLALGEEAFKEVVGTVCGRLDNFGRTQGLEVFGSRLPQRIKKIADGAKFASDTARRGAEPASLPVAAEALLSPARGPLAGAVKKVNALLAENSVDAVQAFAVADATIRKVLGLDSCVTFVQEVDGPCYAACAGEGPLFRQFQNQPLIDPTRRDVFTVCLTQGEDVWIKDPSEARIAPFVPGWFRESARGGSFILLPIKDGAGVFAVMCGLAPPGRRIEHGITRLPQFRMLRSLLSRLRPCLVWPQAAA